MLGTISSYKSENKYVPFLFTIFALFIFILPAFRDISVGTDTPSYFQYYLYPNLGYNQNQEIEVGYVSFSNFMRFLGANFYVFVFIITLISIGSILFFIKKLSNYKLYSLFIFCAAGVTSPMYFLFFSGIRQIMAIAFFILALYFYNKEDRNWFKIILAYAISISFHVSAFIAIPIFFVHKISISSKVAVLLIISTFFMGNIIAMYVSEISVYIDMVTSSFLGFAEKGGYVEQIIDDHTSRQLMIILPYSLISLIICFFAGNDLLKSISNKVFLIGVCLNNLLVFMPMSFRLIIYFVIMIIIILPQFIRDNHSPKWVRIGLFSTTLFYFTYKYIATLEDMATNGIGDNIVPYNFNLF